MRLYPKFLTWAALNIVWLACVLGTVLLWFFIQAHGRFPNALFQGGINSAMQTVAVNVQYKSPGMWAYMLEHYNHVYGVSFVIYPLEQKDALRGTDYVPQEVLETAWSIPRPRMELCPGPMESEFISLEEQVASESGFLPSQNAVFMKSEGEYWYGRPVILPDDSHEFHYVLLAAKTPSFTGGGLFFDLWYPFCLMAVCLGLSFIWWGPFVLYITRPMERITRTAEKISQGDFSPLDLLLDDKRGECRPVFSLTRKDEIGRLSSALDRMSSLLFARMSGQRRFIRHIAHELGAPLARAKFGLGILEDRLDADNAWRVSQIQEEVDQVSEMVEAVLEYLRSEGGSHHLTLEEVNIAEVIKKIVKIEGSNAQIKLNLPDKDVNLLTDQACLLRALENVLRNAVRYAGDAGPITITVRELEKELNIQVCDSGSGVDPADMPRLTEAFFQGKNADAHRGGSGLGLSIVKYCLESCHGRISFCNAEPHGFCVDMYFPLNVA